MLNVFGHKLKLFLCNYEKKPHKTMESNQWMDLQPQTSTQSRNDVGIGSRYRYWIVLATTLHKSTSMGVSKFLRALCC